MKRGSWINREVGRQGEGTRDERSGGEVEKGRWMNREVWRHEEGMREEGRGREVERQGEGERQVLLLH